MKKFCALVLIYLCTLPCISYPESTSDLVSDIKNKEIDITSNFNGSELFIFGASKKQDGEVESNTHGIIIEVIGTTKTKKIRMKDRRFGIWINDSEGVLHGVPDFYFITSSHTITDLLNETNRIKNQIGIENHLKQGNSDVRQEYIEALVRIQTINKLYQFEEGTLDLKDNTLFSTKVVLPNNINEGFYIIKTHLADGTNVINVDKQLLVVKKVGLGNFLFNLAHTAPFTYGVFSIIVALLSGWLASEAFRRLRG